MYSTNGMMHVSETKDVVSIPCGTENQTIADGSSSWEIEAETVFDACVHCPR